MLPLPAPVVPDAATAIRACLSEFPESARDIVEECADIAENACRAAMLQASPVCTCPSGDGSLRWPCPVHPGSSPVIPDGYVMVPVEPNGDMLAAAQDAYGETDGDIASTLRAAMLAADPQLPGGDHATVPGKWIPVSERLPEDSGRYWCYVEEQNDLGKSHYQWNCSWNGDRWWVESEGGGIVTHWMPLPAAPQEVNRE
ncbi:TPA: DUF551 domain-containing protein [Klebsiella pneumoniae]|nr:DUF551 domain-containing protein [Klebsiella pneumoniae]QQO30120.1 DUF551 domain-containing protein [Klebsiella michiganensis]HBQ1252970.1 DUF551 domain-containing protein [Klebsiella pneumoniae]HBV3371090.1 DUF551 domain-containing protein [Klebsiella pneumoniae]HCD2376214.1 DUF551 domain-containing protein [Klebsiella pneumoniae]